MKHSITRWLPTLTPRTALIAAAAAAVIGAGVTATAATPAFASDDKPAVAVEAKKAKMAVKAKKELRHNFQLQSTYFYCGPAATRVALNAHGKQFTQGQVATMLGTTTDGTNSVNEVTRVLNQHLGKGRYHTVEIAAGNASPKHVARLKADVVNAIRKGDPVVANIVGTVRDTKGEVHSYEGGHYIPVIGYRNGGDMVRIADSADTKGSAYYDVSTTTLANWIASRGYSA